MKRFANLFVALGLATAGSTVLAEQQDQQLRTQDAKPQPVQMTDAQLDNVAGGALVAAGNLISVQLQDVVDVNNNNVNVAVPVTAAVGANVGVLSGPQVAAARSGDARARFGRQVQ
jgi:hypothetical protein